jgi:imidazolonepropionase-like amidohydrolase
MSHLRFINIALTALLLSANLFAADEPRTTIVHAGTLLAVPGQDARSEQSLIIVDDKILEVRDGYVAAGDIEGDVSIVDLKDKFVLPGLMDMHVHFTLVPKRPDYMKTSDADYALMAAGNANTTLMAGVTTVRDIGATSAEAIIAVRDAINAGTIPGPRIIAAGESISATAGHGDTRNLRDDVAELMQSKAMCDGADDCRRAVRSQYKLGADMIKVHATGGGADPNGKRFSAPEMFDDELEAIVETAHRLGLKVTAHAHGTAGIKAAIRAGVDSVEHSSWLDEEAIQMYLDTGTYQVTTAYLQDYFLSRPQIPQRIQDMRRANMKLMRPLLREAIQRGVKFAMGTDSGVMPHGQNAKEISKYVELGMSPMEAIETATVNAADLMDLTDQIGTLEAGKFADVIAVDVSPLEDITSLEDVSFVMRSGVVYKSSVTM